METLVDQADFEARRSELLRAGVHMTAPDTVFVDPEAVIEAGVRIGPNVIIKGRSFIKAGTVIEGTAYITDCTIENDCIIRFCVHMEKAAVGSNTSIGPFARLRPEAVLKEDVHLGNFVEIKKATLEKGVKVGHLTYLGDAHVGENTNIGAGTITCNYDGKTKHKTEIGRDAFVGSDSILVAPVSIGEGAYVGAASVVTEAVPRNALAISRPPLVIKPDWAAKRRNKA